MRNQTLKKGYKYDYHILGIDEIKSLTVEVKGKEKVKVPAGKYNCIKVVPYSNNDENIFNENGYMTAWFSDTDEKIPVKIELDKCNIEPSLLAVPILAALILISFACKLLFSPTEMALSEIFKNCVLSLNDVADVDIYVTTFPDVLDNTLIDKYCNLNFRKFFDDKGKLAQKGQVKNEIVEKWLKKIENKEGNKLIIFCFM